MRRTRVREYRETVPQAEIDAACEELGATTPGEQSCVSDSLHNGTDAQDDLDEYRYWRSPHGRAEEARAMEERGEYDGIDY